MRSRFLLAAFAAALSLSAAGSAAAADNFAGKDGSGNPITLCSKDVGAGVQAPCHQLVDTAGTRIDPMTKTGGTVGLVAGAAIVGKVGTDQTTHGTTDLVAADITKVAGSAIAQGHGTAAAGIRVELPSDGTGVVGLNAGSAVVGKISQVDSGGTDATDTTLHAVKTAEQTLYGATITTTITRPADTTAYAINDVLADSTSAPTAGGFTLANACRTSGGTGRLISVAIVSTNDPATTLQGEVWVFDSAVTAVNDNAAFALSDADVVKGVTKIPFALETSQGGSGTNSVYFAGGLDTGFTCSGSRDLRFLVKVKNAYTPASGEALTVRAVVKGEN